ncbi:hypothetical protein BHC47_09780 [Snodgrassella alvi]|uniref:Prepilin-type N-terminal cleavage/methylation domain-containing protein n=1 Tax=Snodgrassella alvi TaxID=1196083 RepID=A0A2N9Y6G1_9NEIS|nr:prepilin-type N-terminal cleavage/methylation domain-containing protein [Snodgrassella alvi]PIT64151.1 hypothetical protein BHC56_05250 [Snodgrassella alvi]PIT64456.1 hypothetical protein BHC47_09780 [Snodgrassella alvi]
MKKNAHIQVNLYKSESKQNLNSLNILKRQTGFSLIELMVASIISIIVLLAASSTFITTYRLKEQVKNRIGYEQDVRNAANILRSDARQLGNFSCLKPPTASNLGAVFDGASFESTQANESQYLSTEFNNNTIGITRTAGSQSLIMTYINEEYANGLVSTDCGKVIPDLANHINAAVYMVGTTDTDNVPGLYRVNYSRGVWTAPQLIVSNVTNVQYSFDYDAHQDANCPRTASQTSNLKNASRNNLDYNFDKPPILIRATLTVNADQANNQNVNYVINAMVRQGEVCINNQAQ